MTILFIILLFACGYTCLFHFCIGLSAWFLFLWVPVGFILGLLTLLLIIYLYALLIAQHQKNDRFLKHFLLRSACHLAMIVMHIKLTVEGRENIPDDTVVIYSNHKSYLDPIMLAYSLKKRPLSAVGKKALFNNHIMHVISNVFKAVELDRDNDREAAKTMVTAIKQVKDGISMIIFPEGGIKTRDVEEMSGLRAGAYKLAMKPQVKILPAAIIGSSVIETTKWYKRKNVTIKYFKPITPEEYKDMNTNDVGLKVEEMINEAIKSHNESN